MVHNFQVRIMKLSKILKVSSTSKAKGTHEPNSLFHHPSLFPDLVSFVSFVQLCCLLQRLDPAVFACWALLKDHQGAGRPQGRVVLVQGLCCIQQQAGEPKEKMKMGSQGQIRRQGKPLLCSGVEVRKVHASLRGQKMMLNHPRQAFSG